jgi:hypothetical protein
MYAPKKRRSNPKIQRKGSQGFPEGLNTLAHPSTLKDTELSELINGIYSQYGTISKRQGTVLIGSPAAGGTAIQQLTATYKVNGLDRLIRISDAGKPEYWNETTGEWALLSATAPAGYSGTNPAFSSGTPTFDTTTTTWVVQLHSRLYFANTVNELIYLDGSQWHIYTAIADPTAKPTVAKTGSATGTTTHYYQYVWYNEVGGTLPSPAPDRTVDADGAGYKKDMPEVLNTTTYLTVTVPTAPAGCTKVGIFKSVNAPGDAFFLDSIEPSQTTFVDQGAISIDSFGAVPSENDTKGPHFKLLDVYQGRLVGVSTEAGDDYLQWGGSLDKFYTFGLPEGGGSSPYREGEGTTINAIKTQVASNENSLFVFKDNCFGKFQFLSVDGEVEGKVQDVNISIGSMSQFSPHIAGNNLRFWGREGAGSVGNEANYGNILRYSVLSLRADAIAQQVTPANLPKVSGVYYKNLSIFGISTDTVEAGNDSCLTYDERYNSWVLWKGIYAAMFAKFISPVDKVERLFYGSSKTADVLQMFTGKTDYGTTGTNGTPVTLSITTKQYDMGFPDQYKRYDKATFVFGALYGGNTTIGITKASHRGIQNDPRLRITSDPIMAGFGNDSWGTINIGTMAEVDQGAAVNLRYVNLRQKDLFWIKINIQNDGILDEVSVIGVYIYYSQSSKPLPFTTRVRALA